MHNYGQNNHAMGMFNARNAVATVLPTATRLLLYYFAAGLFHELSHVAVAVWFDLHHGVIRPDETIVGFLLRVALDRAVHLPLLHPDRRQWGEVPPDDATTHVTQEQIIRHVGWIFSLSLAWMVQRYLPKCKGIRMVTQWTAVDAIVTDLMGFGTNAYYSRYGTFLCGNFGLVMVNPAWTSDQGETAMQILKRMVQVTMVRGAQAGGVICWTSKHGKEEYKGIRSRVVNQKRTDLAEGIHRKVKYDTRNAFGHLHTGIRCFLGHTRFATSSTANFEGTHPHQWSKPTSWRIFPKTMWHVSVPKASRFNVENFVTHNGDFDSYRLNHQYYDLSEVQRWLAFTTGFSMPTPVDSCAIAGCMDILRTQGSFGLSIRFALFLGCEKSVVSEEQGPSHAEYEHLGSLFERSLQQFCREQQCTIFTLSHNPKLRQCFTQHCYKGISDDQRCDASSLRIIEGLVSLIDSEAAYYNRPSLFEFVKVTIDAFLDNDLFHAVAIFLDNAKGSFGLMVTSSLEASRQIVIAARGQPMSVAVFPKKGLICYGSEPAAVKAGLNFESPGGDRKISVQSHHDNLVDGSPAFRVDLDDLGGEVCLIDWGHPSDCDIVSAPYRDLKRHVTMKGNTTLIFHDQNSTIDRPISAKTMMLEDNEGIKPLPEDSKDLVLTDIQDIPAVCKSIQDTWKSNSLNILTSCHLKRCLRARLKARANEKIPVHAGTVDILVTGCEVSLWVAEQFASDLQKAFPKLFIKAVSSNKLLGVFGQEVSVPATGYPMTQHTHDLRDAIVFIVSHSGANFAPLACANLLQSKTRNIFVVTSEFDTQLSKQVRSMSSSGVMAVINNQIFSTESGLRSAEPCSVSVVALHQVLTQIFVDIATMILDNKDFCRLSGAIVTEEDISTLLRCNHDCISALESITGINRDGNRLPKKARGTEIRLRDAGKLWSDHVLEQPRALVMTLIYILVTVTTGYPIFTGLATLAGLDYEEAFYGIRYLDALLYFFLPQINILLLRIFQGRNLRHRMAARTVVIGDIPWVSQAADSFLSKLFACSYSIASVHVLHGNPSDHFVHRHTHRVVRGTLALFGRPDGRLMALTSSEATTCLSVNQTSSIQSYGGTCESITIGHNPSPVAQSHNDLYLPTCRPKYLCEKLLEEETGKSLDDLNTSSQTLMAVFMGWKRRLVWAESQSEDALSNERGCRSRLEKMVLDRGAGKRRQFQGGLPPKFGRPSDPDIQAFMDSFAKSTRSALLQQENESIDDVLDQLDRSRHGTIDFDAFVRAVDRHTHERTRRQLRSQRDTVWGTGSYVGESARSRMADPGAAHALAESQRVSMELYESRCASVQRFVAACVLFHEMARRVESFFPAASIGTLGYRLDRTHSMLRVASTASPVSGADIRERMECYHSIHVLEHAVQVISAAWVRYRRRETKKLLWQRRRRPAGTVIRPQHNPRTRKRSGTDCSSTGPGSSSSSSDNYNSESHNRSSIREDDEDPTEVLSSFSDYDHNN